MEGFSTVLGAGEGVEGGDGGCAVVVDGEGGAYKGADSCSFSKAMACMARAR